MRRKTYERAKEKNDVLAVHTLLLSFKYLSSLEQMCVCLNFDKKKRIICVLFIVMVITFSFICSSLSLSLSLSLLFLSRFLLICQNERIWMVQLKKQNWCSYSFFNSHSRFHYHDWFSSSFIRQK